MKQFLFFLFPVLQINAQDTVAVSKEPRHKNVFENQYVRVLDVRISPGDTTLFHKHETPSVFISLHPVRTGSQVIIEEGSATILSLDRKITFEGFYKTPRIHRVWNADTSEFHVMDIEVLTKGKQSVGPAITTTGFTQLFDAPPVRAYRLVLKGNQKLDLKRSTPILIIGLNDAGNVMANEIRFSKEGDFLFVPSSKKISLTNKNQQEFSFAVLELK